MTDTPEAPTPRRSKRSAERRSLSKSFTLPVFIWDRIDKIAEDKGFSATKLLALAVYHEWPRVEKILREVE